MSKQTTKPPTDADQEEVAKTERDIRRIMYGPALDPDVGSLADCKNSKIPELVIQWREKHLQLKTLKGLAESEDISALERQLRDFEEQNATIIHDLIGKAGAEIKKILAQEKRAATIAEKKGAKEDQEEFDLNEPAQAAAG